MIGNCYYPDNISLYFNERVKQIQSETTILSKTIHELQEKLVQFDKRYEKINNCTKTKINNPIPSNLSPLQEPDIELLDAPTNRDYLHSEPQDMDIDDINAINELLDDDIDIPDDSLDLSKFGSSDSAVWGDGWKLSNLWMKKHPPTRVPKKRDCVVCGARCVMICQICNVHLHTRAGCYAKFHMNPEKYNDKPKKGHVCKACGKPRKGHPGKPGLKHCIYAKK